MILLIPGLAAAVLFLLLLATPFPPALDAYIGEYALVASESADMRRVIDETAAGLNFLLRPIARSRLRKTQIAFPSVSIGRTLEGFRIAHVQGTDIVHRNPEDAVRTVAPDGSKILVRLDPGPPLTQTYESSEGLRINSYVLASEGSKLTLHVRLRSPRLPKPIEYTLVYRRK